jgi:hypothetical protein
MDRKISRASDGGVKLNSNQPQRRYDNHTDPRVSTGQGSNRLWLSFL